MEMTQRGRLDEAQKDILEAVMREMRRAEAARKVHRRTVVKMVEESSFREVSDATGISTTTLQRWKREAE